MITIDRINAQQIDLLTKAVKQYRDYLSSQYNDEKKSDVTLNDLVIADSVKKVLDYVDTLYYTI